MEKEIEFVVEDSRKATIEKIKREMLSILDEYFDLYLDRSDDSTDLLLDPIFKNNRKSGKLGESNIDFDPIAYRIVFFRRAIGLLQIDEEPYKTIRVKIISILRDENLKAEKGVNANDPHNRTISLVLDSETNAAAFMNLLFGRVQQVFGVAILKQREGESGRPVSDGDYHAWKCLHIKGYSDKDEQKIKAEWIPSYMSSRNRGEDSSMAAMWNNIKKPDHYKKRYEKELRNIKK
jgi:hypothetical protein